MPEPSEATTPTPAGAAPPSDEDVLAAVAAGRPHAFDVLVARYGARVQTFLRHRVGDAAWAEDLAQEVFVKVFRHLDRREPGGSFPVWLFAIARNVALDHLRRRTLQRRVLDAAARGDGPLARAMRRVRSLRPDEELATGELASALEDALAELPGEQREVFLLREREGLRYGEIAAVVGCGPKTVSTRLARARARLREDLGDHVCGAAPPGGAL